MAVSATELPVMAAGVVPPIAGGVAALAVANVPKGVPLVFVTVTAPVDVFIVASPDATNPPKMPELLNWIDPLGAAGFPATDPIELHTPRTHDMVLPSPSIAPLTTLVAFGSMADAIVPDVILLAFVVSVVADGA